jgi:hypothetical protein
MFGDAPSAPGSAPGGEPASSVIAPAASPDSPGKVPTDPATRATPDADPNAPAAAPAAATAAEQARLLDFTRLEGEAVTYKQAAAANETRAKTAETRLAELEAKLKDPFEALILAGTDVEQFVQDLGSKKLKIPAKGQPMDPAMKAIADRLAAREAKEAAAEAAAAKQLETAAAQERTTRELGIVAATLKENAATAPVLQGLDWASQTVLNAYNADVAAYNAATVKPERPDLAKVAIFVNDKLQADVALVLRSEHGRKALLADPLVREAVIKELGLQQPSTEQPAKSKAADQAPPASAGALSSTHQSLVPTRSTPLTDKERVEAAVAAVPNVFR